MPLNILHRDTGAVIYTSASAASTKDAVLDAVNGGADLRGANLIGADLRGAYGINPYQTTPLHLLSAQQGPVRAYKLVRADGQGPFTGGLTYEVGGSYSVLDADTDPSVDCGAGIGLASLDWCMSAWAPTYRILLAEFTADDIAAIPTGSDGKFRVHRCTIVDEVDLETVWPEWAAASAGVAALSRIAEVL